MRELSRRGPLLYVRVKEEKRASSFLKLANGVKEREREREETWTNLDLSRQGAEEQGTFRRLRSFCAPSLPDPRASYQQIQSKRKSRANRSSPSPNRTILKPPRSHFSLRLDSTPPRNRLCSSSSRNSTRHHSTRHALCRDAVRARLGDSCHRFHQSVPPSNQRERRANARRGFARIVS